MSDALTKICADKVDHVAASKAARSLADVETDAQQASAPRVSLLTHLCTYLLTKVLLLTYLSP